MRGQSTLSAPAHQRDVPRQNRGAGRDVDLELVGGELERLAAAPDSGSAEARLQRHERHAAARRRQQAMRNQRFTALTLPA